MLLRNLENSSTLKTIWFLSIYLSIIIEPAGVIFDPAMTPRGRGQKPRRGRGLQFWTGFWPRGVGVKIFFRGRGQFFFRGHDPAGAGAIKRGRGFDPACYGAMKRGRGFGPAFYGAIKRGRGFSPACCGVMKRGRGRGQNGVDPVTPFWPRLLKKFRGRQGRCRDQSGTTVETQVKICIIPSKRQLHDF